MKKLERLDSKKFDSFESQRITSLSRIFGGELINSPKDRSGCTDTFSWTPRNITVGTDSNGNPVVMTVNDKDNLQWDCDGVDTTITPL
jgi:hypothetical protein